MKKFNEFAGASQAYEAPEIETIEVRMGLSVMSGCAGVVSEEICLEDTDCPEDFI